MPKITRKTILDHFSLLYSEKLKAEHPLLSWGATNSQITVLFAFTKDVHPHDPELVTVLDVDPCAVLEFSEAERETQLNEIMKGEKLGIVVMVEALDPQEYPVCVKRFTDFFEIRRVELAHGRVYAAGKRRPLPQHLTL